MAVNTELLDLLACPRCHGSLLLEAGEEGLSCAACRVVYPIREDIPVMLVEEAVPEDAWRQGARDAKQAPAVRD